MLFLITGHAPMPLVFFDRHSTAVLLLGTTLCGVIAAPGISRGQDDASSPADAVPAGTPPMQPVEESELTDEQKQAIEQFVEQRQTWAELIRQMHRLEVLYNNGVQQTPQDLERFRELRDEGRSQMRQLFQAAHRLQERLPNDPESLAFIGMTLEYRRDRSMYDDSYQAARTLLDNGIDQPVLHLIAARTAMLEGQFDEVIPLYQKFVDQQGVDKLEDVDQRFAALVEEVYPPLWQEELEHRRRDSERDDLPRVELQTTAGRMVVELFEDQAPNTVANFIRLVERDFYDQTEFYQVINDLVAVGGDPIGDGSGTSGKFIPDELHRDEVRQVFRGSLMMARMPDGSGSGRMIPDTASCQFLIAMVPLVSQQDDQVAFGRVIEGMDTVGALRRIDPTEKKEDEIVLPPDRILGARVLRKRDHDYQVSYVEPSGR